MISLGRTRFPKPLLPVGKQQLLCLSVCLGRLPLCIVYSISSCMRRTAFLDEGPFQPWLFPQRYPTANPTTVFRTSSSFGGTQRSPTCRLRSHSGCWGFSLAEEIESSLFLAPGIAHLAGGSSKVEETTDALKRASHWPAEAKDTPSMTLLRRTGRTAAPHRFLSWTEVNFLPTSFL